MSWMTVHSGFCILSGFKNVVHFKFSLSDFTRVFVIPQTISSTEKDKWLSFLNVSWSAKITKSPPHPARPQRENTHVWISIHPKTRAEMWRRRKETWESCLSSAWKLIVTRLWPRKGEPLPQNSHSVSLNQYRNKHLALWEPLKSNIQTSSSAAIHTQSVISLLETMPLPSKDCLSYLTTLKPKKWFFNMTFIIL